MTEPTDNILDWIQAYQKMIAEPKTVLSSSDGKLYKFEKTFNRIQQAVNGKWVSFPNVLPRIEYSVITQSATVFKDLPKEANSKKTKRPCCD